jgi:hypothetical protein
MTIEAKPLYITIVMPVNDLIMPITGKGTEIDDATNHTFSLLLMLMTETPFLKHTLKTHYP